MDKNIREMDIRWVQRLQNFNRAMTNLRQAVSESKQRSLNQLEKQGLIQAFEYNYELSWKVIKDFYEAQGETDIQGSRDAFMLAFNRGLVKTNGHLLIEAIRSRQLTSHTYNENTAEEIYHDIINKYFTAFQELLEILNNEKKKIIDS